MSHISRNNGVAMIKIPAVNDHTSDRLIQFRNCAGDIMSIAVITAGQRITIRIVTLEPIVKAMILVFLNSVIICSNEGLLYTNLISVILNSLVGSKKKEYYSIFFFLLM